MSIRMIAKELYLLKKEKEKLEEALENALPENKEALKDLVRKKTAEFEKVQGMLNAAKEPPHYRRPM